jgi:hypothetical protein
MTHEPPRTAFPKTSRSGLVCFIFLCGGNSCLLHNASKCDSSGTEINQRFLACGNPKQLWFSIVHTFTVDAFSTRQRREICCNWAVSVRSMAATFQQFDQMLDWNWNPVEDHRRSISGRTPSQPTVWTLHEIHEHSPLQWLCLGLVFWFCERVYLAALVAEEQWRRSVPSKRDIWIGRHYTTFWGTLLCIFFAIDLEVALHGAKTRNELCFWQFLFLFNPFPKMKVISREEFARAMAQDVRWTSQLTCCGRRCNDMT